MTDNGKWQTMTEWQTIRNERQWGMKDGGKDR